jgi:hypothetical protein
MMAFPPRTRYTWSYGHDHSTGMLFYQGCDIHSTIINHKQFTYPLCLQTSVSSIFFVVFNHLLTIILIYEYFT